MGEDSMSVSFVADESFESYSKRFAEHFIMTRSNGVIEVRMHEGGQTPRWSYELHRAWPQMFAAVGADRENELLIISGTGERWLAEGFNEESFGIGPEEFRRRCYDIWYVDGTKLQENQLWSVDIPIIGVINGPGHHLEIGLLADLTICADDVRFMEAHIPLGMVPGDGQYLVYQELLGVKRANYLALASGGVDADEAVRLGMVNEAMPRDRLMPRAYELAAEIMKSSRVVRRLTTQLARRRWKRLFSDDFNMHFGFELFASTVYEQSHDSGKLNEALRPARAQAGAS
jgi:enoyl-CoA hydratase/carnithine racemase